MRNHAALPLFRPLVNLQRGDPANRRLAFTVCQIFLSLGKSVTSTNKFLPQGAPTSPFLSNLMMKLADIRLSALARSFGGFYTRYAVKYHHRAVEHA